MVDDQYMAQIAAMQRQNDAAMKEQMIKLGLDPSEIAAASTYDDPVLAEIERDMLRGGKQFHTRNRSGLKIYNYNLDL